MSLIPSGFAKSAAAGGFYDHPIDQSLRFNNDDSPYLSRTPASAGNRKTYTLSAWVKICVFGSSLRIFEAGTNSSTDRTLLYFSGDQFHFYTETGNVVKGYLSTNAVFRDPSAWYHVVWAVDAANTSVKIYVNGVEQTLTTTTSVANENTYVNATNVHYISQSLASSGYFDGYMAEVNFIDGTALDATSFGEFKSGVWIPKAYSGSYGTNGFYLDFGNSGSIGADVSGNGNNFTANNLAATDVVLDSPTNNFATLNPLDPHGGNAGTLAEGNLKHISESSGSWTRSTFWMGSGKWYSEWLFGSGSYLAIQINYGSTYASYANDGNIIINGSSVGTYSTFTTGDIIGVAIDRDANTVKFYKNNSLVYTGTSLASGDMKIGFYITSPAGNYSVANFGQDSSFAGNKTAQGNTDANGYGDFYYAPPTGYLALCTANLEVPDAMNPALDNSPQDYFNTVLYTGNGTSQSITGVGLQPSWTWIKRRDAASYHHIYDAIRGGTKVLYSNATDSEQTSAGGLTSFDSDGFSIGNHASVNTSGGTYVAWNWKANGSGVSNTDGSITSTVSANTDAGFSIVSYTGNTTLGATVGHGLGVAPDMIIVKARDASGQSWVVGHSGIGWGYHLLLSGTNAQSTATNTSFNGTAPTSSVFSLGNDTQCNESPYNYIAYCFAEVEGFSKFGSYTGNGSTDGPFCYTGFKPAFVMVKNANVANSWRLWDNKRPSYNVTNLYLSPDTSGAEGAINIDVDFTSNGFKIRNTNSSINGSGNTIIYMAFAEMPTKFCASMAR